MFENVDYKKAFIKEFERLIKKTSEYADIRALEYGIDTDGRETLYVLYESSSQKKININADSCAAIMQDFFIQLNKAPWLDESEMFIYPDASKTGGSEND